jgi:hypothetical protein
MTTKYQEKSEEILCIQALVVLFRGLALEASPVDKKSFINAKPIMQFVVKQSNFC